MNVCPRTRLSGAAGIRSTAPKRLPNSNAWSGGRSAATNSAETLKSPRSNEKFKNTSIYRRAVRCRLPPRRREASSMPTAQEKQERIRIGVDLGGTKIEFVALERDGRELHRHRMATPRFDYEGTVRAVAEAAEEIEKKLGRSATVGRGFSVTIPPPTSTVFPYTTLFRCAFAARDGRRAGPSATCQCRHSKP